MAAEGNGGIDFDAFEALTFDCYGTLIDWEAGLVAALRPVLGNHGVAWPGDDAMLERFGRLESAAESGPFRRYRDVLGSVLDGLAGELGFVATADEREGFPDSVRSWPVFPDTTEALRALGRRYRLAIVSNVDDDLFDGSAELIGVPFDQVVTAQQVGSYKPAPGHFDEVLNRLALPRERVLHVAQSLFHDVAPARALGFTCVWVNRRRDRPGGGATPPAHAVPDLEVASLDELARRAGV